MGEPIDITATDVTLRVTVGGGAPALVVAIGGRDQITIRGTWRDLSGLVGGASGRLSQLLRDYPELRSAPCPSGAHEPGPLGPTGSLAKDPGRGGRHPSAAQSSAATGPVGYRRPGE
jgi:hypothetical protein